MRRGVHRPPTATRVMRRGKTKRDRATGAWENHKRNKEWRRLEGRLVDPR